MTIPLSSVSRTVAVLLTTEARQATVYLDPITVVTATRRFKRDKRNRFDEVLLKLGKPNFREREFIKVCQKAGEPFPVRKVQLKFWPKK